MSQTKLELHEMIEKAREYVWSTQNDSSPCWLYDPYLGPSFTGCYYLVLNYLGVLDRSRFDVKTLKDILVRSQLPDGGWLQVPEVNRKSSDLDSSVFNYWFLKASGCFRPDEEIMRRAREFILAQGGLEACSHMSKIWMCLFGQYSWDLIAPIPLLVFRDSFMGLTITNVRGWVAQWVYSHLLPIAYLRYWKKQKFLGEKFNMGELLLNPETKIIDYSHSRRAEEPPYDVKNIMDKLNEMRRPLGSYGAYTVSTLYALICLEDWREYYGLAADEDTYKAQFDQSLRYVDETCLGGKHHAYMGVLDDGRWWDTLLATLGLLETGQDPDRLVPVIEHFIKHGVQSCGGIAYGLEFEYCPDTDDTAIMVVILAKYFRHKYSNLVEKANAWLVSMQNSDGGYGAFAKENNSWLLVKLFAGNFQNSAEIFDSSSVDVTAHVLEAWAMSGHSFDEAHVVKAVDYLKRQQTEFGAWEGRWGCNYIYSVGAVISALAQFKNLKIDQEPWLVKSVEWLLTCQNADGGFGESNLSYTQPEWIGRGKSTASQTSWALLALNEFYNSNKLDCQDAIKRAVNFLKSNFKDSKWHDVSSVGTGHRKLLYMQYPVYPIAWPMIALGRYAKLVELK